MSKLSIVEQRIQKMLDMIQEGQGPSFMTTSQHLVPRANRCKIFRNVNPMDSLMMALNLGLIYRTRNSDTDNYQYGITTRQEATHQVMDD